MRLTCENLSIDWEAVEESRHLPPGRKAEIGGELFLSVCDRMREGIRSQHPTFTEDQVTAELLRRLDLSRLLESRL